MIELAASYLVLIKDILVSPWLHSKTLWVVLPLVLILFLIHLYFGRYRSEELGWNSAFGNSISLLWICMILFRFLFEKYGLGTIVSETEAMNSFIVVAILTIWVFLLLIFNFFHVMPKKLAFVVSSSGSVYVLAYIITSVIVGDFALNLKTLIASLILFILLAIALQGIKHMIPMSQSARQVLKERRKREGRKKGGKKSAKSRKKKGD